MNERLERPFYTIRGSAIGNRQRPVLAELRRSILVKHFTFRSLSEIRSLFFNMSGHRKAYASNIIDLTKIINSRDKKLTCSYRAILI